MADISIHSFSKLSGIESSKLRYWEALGVFSPMGRNPSTRYRFYSKSQLLNLLYVMTLCALNIPLKIIAQLATKRNPESLLKLYDRQEKILDMEMNSLLRQNSLIHTRRELIYQGLAADERQIHIVPRDEKAIILWPIDTDIGSESDAIIEALASIITVAPEYYINLSFPIGGIFHDMDSFKKTPISPNQFFSIDPIGRHKQSAGDYLTGYYRGFYKNLNDTPKRMSEYAMKNSLELLGPVYLEYLIDETCTDNPNQFLARYSIAVKR